MPPERSQLQERKPQSWSILPGDCRASLATLDVESVQTCVTSPPYYGLRDYGTGEWEGGDSGCTHREGRQTGRVTPASKNGSDNANVTRWATCGHCGAVRVDHQIGLEPTPDEFVAALVEVFRGVRRVLRDDGTVWLNLGDSYATRWSSRRTDGGRAGLGPGDDRARHHAAPEGFKTKDLIGIPWMVAFALRADGWYLRSDIIWAKPNPMPESVTDRPTRAHEYLFLLSKSPRYYYDAAAIKEEGVWPGQNRMERPPVESAMPGAPAHRGLRQDKQRGHGRRHAGFNDRWDSMSREEQTAVGRNKRSVWTVATQPYAGAHFATFPPKLIEPCILAGCAEGGTVLDPFAGACTTGMVALRHNRSFIGCELNPEYVTLGRDRIIADSPLLNTHAEAA